MDFQGGMIVLIVFVSLFAIWLLFYFIPVSEIGTWNVLESRDFGLSNRACDTFNRRTAVLFKIISDDSRFICLEYSSCIYKFYF